MKDKVLRFHSKVQFLWGFRSVAGSTEASVILFESVQFCGQVKSPAVGSNSAVCRFSGFCSRTRPRSGRR